MSSQSPLQQARLQYQPELPIALQNINTVEVHKLKDPKFFHESPEIADIFPLTHEAPFLEFKSGAKKSYGPLRVGVVLSGGQAPGGHNVITGLHDALKKMNAESSLIGFLDGPSGIVGNQFIELTDALIQGYRNQGGFDMIGSGRTKIETQVQFLAALETVKKHKLDGLVVIGGDDSNTNAALLAEYFIANECNTTVVGVPKTIDGDLKSEAVEISFGFDTAAKHYSETIGSLMRDVLSAKKYYHFVKLMGRSASHIALECALQTHPNLAFISEEVAVEKKSLKNLVDDISDLVCKRALDKKEYGVILIPEGVVEFIPEVKKLIEELNGLLAVGQSHSSALDNLESEKEKIEYISKLLTEESLACFNTLPMENRSQLLIGRDSHGNVQVSRIETERLMIEMVKKELSERSKTGSYKGSFSPLSYFCGYEGRSCLPSNFDSRYCYALGHVAALLVDDKANGYICCLGGLTKPVEEWIPGGVPLTTMMTIEERNGKTKPVIRKALVDLKGKPFAAFQRQRGKWADEDSYMNPGPIQFFGPEAIMDSITHTLSLEQS
ncbi:MAG TPA: diphosphate--fructose-6-phosphate 1-phosphotransferase [Parachlamydiaceae bacterium]|nr:diphosphate--fructose-6-phosphate 1-phosphotransferase [Parachlamydiaceae bacterium]